MSTDVLATRFACPTFFEGFVLKLPVRSRLAVIAHKLPETLNL